MKSQLYVCLLVAFFMTLSCAKVMDTSGLPLTKGKTYAVIPFENYTDTPLAGYRVASMLEGILRAKGYKVADRVWEYTDREPSKEDIRNFLHKSLKKAEYVFFGSVNEFRYKTGIDGEPAVSISIFLIESSTGRIIGGSSLSASGWAHESLGTVAQELLRKAIE